MIKIAQLERDTVTGGVTVAHWTASKSDGDYSASSYGTVGFTPDPDADGFVAFDSLTEAQVIAWVESELDLDTISEQLCNSISEQQSPATVAGLPW